jgi:hypothetical protein
MLLLVGMKNVLYLSIHPWRLADVYPCWALKTIKWWGVVYKVDWVEKMFVRRRHCCFSHNNRLFPQDFGFLINKYKNTRGTDYVVRQKSNSKFSIRLGLSSQFLSASLSTFTNLFLRKLNCLMPSELQPPHLHCPCTFPVNLPVVFACFLLVVLSPSAVVAAAPSPYRSDAGCVFFISPGFPLYQAIVN